MPRPRASHARCTRRLLDGPASPPGTERRLSGHRSPTAMTQGSGRKIAAELYASGCSVLSQRWRPEGSICRSGESMRGRAGWRPDQVMAGPRADSRVPEGGPAELRRRRGLAAPGRVDRYTEDPRPVRRRPFGSGEATSSSEPASASVVVRGVPGDLGGNTAGEVVRQASDDDRDGGNVPGRLATYGQHGVVLAAPGRQVRPGSLRAELPCPLKAGHGLGCRTRTRARPAAPGTISGDYALESGTTTCMVPAHLSQARGTSRSSSRSSFTVPRRPVNDRCHRGRSRYPHSTSSADSFVGRLVCHGQHAGVPRP